MIENKPKQPKAINTIVIMYVLLKILTFIIAVEGDLWIFRVISGFFMLLLIPLNNSKFLTKRTASALIPFLATVIESIVCVATGGDRLYFTYLIGSVALSFIYVDVIGLALYIGLANLVAILFTFILKYPMLGISYTLYDSVFQFLAFVLISIIFFFICFFSVGKYKKFENTSRTYNKIMETTPNFMVVTNDQTEVTDISNTLLKWLGVDDRQYALGRPLMDLFASGDMKMIFHEVMEDSGYVEKDFQLNIDAKTHWFKLQSSLLNTGSMARSFEWVDITPLVDAKNEAESASHVKSDFLARMSHEIRTPMNAIVGMAELILREDIPPRVYGQAMNVKNAGNNLLSIINDILDISKIESGKLEIIASEYLFASLINDVLSIIRMRIAEKQILFITHIDSNLPNKLIGDEVRIRQILLNLLGNAVKYTHEGSISIAVSGSLEGENTFVLNIEIADSGVGIKEDDLKRLFEDFTQVDVIKNREVEGTGLGLAITKNLCQAMGGGVSVRSEYGKGSIFTATIPQKFKEYEKFASVENPDEKSVLIYEPRLPYAHSIVYALDNLGIRNNLVITQSELHEELKNFPYPYIFAASFLYENIRRLTEDLGLSAKLVLMTEFGETANYANARTIPMPVYALAVANVLNDVHDTLTYNQIQETYIRFIAPQARILVVDDVNTNLQVAEGLMLPYKMMIDTCNSGAEAIERVKANQYDLIFMDHMMPEMDGIEATAVIRSLEGEYFQKIPIVALTANAISGVKEMFLKNGLNDFLAKPIETAKLNSTLEKWIPCEKRQKKDQNEKTEPLPVAAEFKIEGVDTAQGLSLTGGTLERYIKTLSIFYKDALAKIAEVQACLHQPYDLRLFTTYVHALKSASASIGAATVSSLAEALETAGHQKDTAFIQVHTTPFLNELTSLLEDIDTALKGSKEAETEPAENDTVLLKQTLENLKAALENMDAGEINIILNKLEGNTKMDAIIQSILLFEYEEAIAQIDALLQF